MEMGYRVIKFANEVYVITRLNNKQNIEEELKTKNYKNIEFIYFDLPKWFTYFFKGKYNQFSYFYFYVWQIGIFFRLKKFIRKKLIIFTMLLLEVIGIQVFYVY